MTSHPIIRPTRDGSLTVYSATYEQTYHSIHGALTEARHVFLKGTGVSQRFLDKKPTALLEVGLGTGMNFLLSASEALDSDSPLDYWALEHYPLPLSVFAQLQFEAFILRPELMAAYAGWLETMGHASAGDICTFSFRDTITLKVLIGDATTASLPHTLFHAVYLDAFSPNVNPELWTSRFLSFILNAMQSGGCLATYSARRLVRENLAAAGFTVHKRQGPPGKREMVIAIKP